MLTAAAVLQWQMWGVKIEIFWPSKLKMQPMQFFYRKSLPTLLRSLFLNTGYILQSTEKIQKVNAGSYTHRFWFDWVWSWTSGFCLLDDAADFFLIIEVQFTPYKNIHLKRNSSHLKSTTLLQQKLQIYQPCPTSQISFLNSHLKSFHHSFEAAVFIIIASPLQKSSCFFFLIKHISYLTLNNCSCFTFSVLRHV